MRLLALLPGLRNGANHISGTSMPLPATNRSVTKPSSAAAAAARPANAVLPMPAGPCKDSTSFAADLAQPELACQNRQPS